MRCGYCRERGHNIKSCVKIKEAAANGLSKAEENRSFMERYAITKTSSMKRAADTVVRTCSYCGQPKHTRRTCATLAEHAKVRNQLETRWRHGVAKLFSKSSVKIGSLVEWNTWSGYAVTAIINGLNVPKLLESKFGIFAMETYGANVNRYWFDYTIISVHGGEGNRWGKPEEGTIYSEAPPTYIMGEKIFPFNAFGREDDEYGTRINILSEGVSPVEFPESWLNGADATLHLDTVKNVSPASFDAKHQSIKNMLDSVGF